MDPIYAQFMLERDLVESASDKSRFGELIDGQKKHACEAVIRAKSRNEMWLGQAFLQGL